jgi:peptide/nickel transport system permease protein
MTKYIVQRILVSIPVFLGITLLVYGLYSLSPGDPVINIVGIEQFTRMTSEQRQQVRVQYGFDKPWTFRYVRWLGKLLQGDLGYPLKGAKPVAQQIMERIPLTFLLMGTALLLSLIIGVPVGIIMALKQYSALDMVLTVLVFAFLALPSFFVGLGCIYIFALKLGILPVYGTQTIGAPFSLIDRARHLIMPAAILGLAAAGTYARYTRASMLDVMRSEYVITARAKGLKERVVVVRHIFRNALLPIVTIVAAELPFLLAGAIITEQIFQWPGIGMLTVKRTSERDYPVLMGITVFTAIIILFSNLLADILYAAIDPRIRYDKAA